jgi:hypothetical protein
VNRKGSASHESRRRHLLLAGIRRRSRNHPRVSSARNRAHPNSQSEIGEPVLLNLRPSLGLQK